MRMPGRCCRRWRHRRRSVCAEQAENPWRAAPDALLCAWLQGFLGLPNGMNGAGTRFGPASVTSLSLARVGGDFSWPEAVRVLAVNGAAALNAGFIPDDEIPGSRDRPRNRVGGAPPRSRRCARAFECPGPPRSGDSPALVPARRSECARCPKRRRSARAPCSATPKAHRKHNENTRPSHGFLKIPRLPRL